MLVYVSCRIDSVIIPSITRQKDVVVTIIIQNWMHPLYKKQVGYFPFLIRLSQAKTWLLSIIDFDQGDNYFYKGDNYFWQGR